jgi:hypothetical protein
MVMSMKMAVFWDTELCSLVDIDQYLPDYMLQHPEDSHLHVFGLHN